MSHRVIFSVILVLLTTGIYWEVLSGNFVWDDRLYLLRDTSGGPHPLIRTLQEVIANFTNPAVSYRPLFSASLYMDFKIGGLDPRVYHATSLLLYLLNILLVFGIAVRFWGDGWLAPWTALLFAVHPIHVEAIGWISARSDLICSLFFLASVYCYLIYREASSRFRGAAYAASLTGFILALASKEMAIALPFIVLASRLWFPSSEDQALPVRKRAAFSIVPYFVVLAGYLIWRMTHLESASSDHLHVTPAARILKEVSPDMVGTISLVTLHYLRLFLLPFSLRAVYDLPPVSDFFDPTSLSAVGGITALAIGAVVLHRHSMRLFWAATWTALTMGPAYLLIVTRNPILMAERYVFLASVGFCFFIVGVGNWFYNRRPAASITRLKQGYIGAGIAVVAIFAFLTVQRTMIWKDEKTLWYDTVQKSPRSSLARTNLGHAYLQENRPDLAVAELETALELDPNNGAAHEILAGLYYHEGRIESAIPEYEAAVRLDPNRFKAHYALGVIHLNRGKMEEAVNSLQRALAIQPGYTAARLELGVAYHTMGRYAEAIEEYQKVLAQEAAFPMVHYNIGLSFWKAGEHEKAVVHFRRFTEVASPRYESYRQSALSYLRQSRRAE